MFVIGGKALGQKTVILLYVKEKLDRKKNSNCIRRSSQLCNPLEG